MTQQPNLLQGPEPVETADLHFKQYSKLKLFETQTKYEDGHCNLVAVSQHYGLIFARNLSGFSVIKSKSITPTTDLDLFPRRDITLDFRPTHIAVDFSQKVLAVVCTSKPGAMLLLYNIASFATKDVIPLKITHLSKLVQNLAADVSEMTWQPNTDSGLTMCMSDGSVVALSQPNTDAGVFTLPNSTQATCLCWSPKGKQIVIGCANGTLSQYKPNLKVVKTLQPPPLFNGSVMVISVLWISSYQFAVAYNDRSNPESFPVITIVNAPKNEQISVINYDDITYSSTLFRNHQIYMSHQSAWNLIFVSSANSIEVAVLHSKDGTSWEQWLLGDASRAELPLNPDRQETFPLGWAFDYTSEATIPWGEGTLPPMPRVLLLSDEGLLCIFNVVNVAENVPQLCAPPKENLDDSLFTAAKPAAVAASVASQPPIVSQTPLGFPIQSSPTLGNLKPSYTFGSTPTFGGISVQPQTTVPQVTISLQGGPVLGGVKDAQLILQQQHQLQQQGQSIPLTTQSVQSTPTLKFSMTPQFGATTGAPISFGTSNTSSLFAAKAAAAASESATATKFGAPQENLFMGKPVAPQTDIFQGKALSQSTPIKKPEPEQKPTAKPPPTVKPTEEVSEASTKAEEAPAKGKSPGESPEPKTPKLATVDDSVYWNALQEEIDHFNSELLQLSERVSTLDIEVGTAEEKKRMRESIETLYNFWKELKETTESQKCEIHSVVMDLMESFAWLEDAKSRNLQRKNPSYIELKKSEELDPLSARHMSDIAHYKYYIENQLKQLTSHLEKEWMDHQESFRMEVKNRMTIPPLEEVYKTMHFQLKILNKQRAFVEELKESIALRKRKNKSQTSIISTSSPVPPSSNGARVSELSKLAENLLQLRINREEKSSKSENWDMVKTQLRAIAERSKKLTDDKQVALRDALSERDMVRIRPVKTTFESSSFLRTAPLEKTLSKQKVEVKAPPKEKEKTPPSPIKTTVTSTPKVTPPPMKPPPQMEGEKAAAGAAAAKKGETPKGIFVFGVPAEKPTIPLTVQSLPPKPEETTPLASLSGIVSNIGKEPESLSKPAPTFFFGTPAFQKQEPQKEIVFVLPKPEETKPLQGFSFAVSKPAEPVFSKNEPPKFGTNLTFGLTTSTPSSTVASTKPIVTLTTTTTATPAPNISISFGAATTVPPAANTISSSMFSFAPSTTADNAATSAGLPKMNLLFSGKEQSSVFGSPATTASIFSSSTANTSSTGSIFGSSTPLFGKTDTVSTTSLFGGLKTSETLSFGLSQSADTKSKVAAEPPVVVISSNPTLETTEEVDVVTVEEPPKKSEEVKEKNSPKVTVASSVFGTTLEAPKLLTTSTTTTTTASATPPSVQVVSTQSSTTITATTTATTSPVSIFAKPAAPTTTEAPTVSKPAATTAASAPLFSLSSPIVFGQTATTTAVTTTTSILGHAPSTTTSIFGQVSSTTPTTNIFGGSTPTTPSDIFGGGSTPTSKPVFVQALTPSTTSSSIFETTTPTTSAFGQPSTPASPSAFGQKPDAVGQTANIFSQLLSDSNRSGSVFGTPASTPTTTGNIFGTPKNIFARSTTAAPVFGGTTSPSVFPQTTSVFGQATTSTSIFGQPQTSTSNSFFGQNICSPSFGGGTSVTSNQSTFDSGGFNSKPLFGQSLFGQTTSNTSIFGGSSNTSIFGGSSTSGSNVFQTPTTSTTFGSVSPGPFSSSQGSVAETGFAAAANTFQKPSSGFGSPPVFGSGPPAPAFGGSPTFGGSASFGSLPTFGSRPFESSPGATFGQSPGHSTTFENLANQNTVGFGNLAQQSQSQGFGGSPGRFGSPSFENKPAFGGDSFSSWRS